jgi:arylsulfatase A-like enzyme
VAPLTLPAHTSLFTGLYPPHHGVRDNTDHALDPAHATLATLLHDRGFRTAAFVGAIVLSADRGVSRGFDVYDDGRAPGTRPPRRRPGREVVDRARAWIDRLDEKPFFLWVHLYDVHAPQELPLEFRRAYGDGYEGGIAYVDDQIGRLLDALRRRDRLSNTVIVVAGDHGESLGEHGEQEHGIFLYESTLRVPLVICAPGVAARRVEGVTSLVDIFPTVLRLLGVAVPTPGDGVSLVTALSSGRIPERTIYAESLYAAHFGWGPLRMVRDSQFKFIDAPTPELYDLGRDPNERQNLAGEHLATAAALRGELLRLTQHVTPDRDAFQLPPERLQALEALGYVGR